MQKRFTKQELLALLEEIIGEKYEFGKSTIVDDLTNSMNILIVEMLDLVKIEDCLEIAGIRTNRIIEYNENVLDKYCDNYENSKYTTLQKLIDVTIFEMNKIIGDKISGINTLLYMLFQVDCNEINNLFDYSDEELNMIDPNTLEETIGVSTEEYIEDISSKIGTIDKNKNYFIELIHYISVNLDEELNWVGRNL